MTGKTLTVDMNEEEEAIFFMQGLQLMVDRDLGKNKFKVMPHDKKIKVKKGNKIEISDEDHKECVKLAIIDAIKTYVNKI